MMYSLNSVVKVSEATPGRPQSSVAIKVSEESKVNMYVFKRLVKTHTILPEHSYSK